MQTGSMNRVSTEIKPRRLALRGLSADHFALILAAILIAFALAAILAPWLPIPDPNAMDLSSRLLPPVWERDGNWGHVLGTDFLGRDMAARLLVGGRLTLMIGFLAVVVSGTLGTTLGLLAGYHGGWLDYGISRIVDAQLAIPFLLMAMAIIVSRGRSIEGLIVALSFIGWAKYARIIRSETLALRQRPFVLGLRVAGAGSPRILFLHILPNISRTLIVVTTLEVGTMILTESALSFLGLGVVPPDISWGAMLAEGRTYMNSSWWLIILPGLAITFIVVLVNFLGDALQSAYDPMARKW